MNAPVAAPLSVPNVFVSYECERTGAAEPKPAASIRETYARCGEDLIVEGLLAARFALSGRELDSVFYVEIGARHPVQTSNTYLFYRKHGASGLLVEANAGRIEDLRRVRPRDVVLRTAVSGGMDATLAAGVCEAGEFSWLSLDRIQPSSAAHNVVPNLHINDLLAGHVERPVDFLAIDFQTAAAELIEALDLTRFRPLLIQCQPGEHSLPGTSIRIVQWLQERGYTLAARTSDSLVFIDTGSLGAGLPLPAVNSFDVFDTLIARRCVDAARIFEALEVTHGVAGFARSRREAEWAVSGPDLTLDGIYGELAHRLALSPELAGALRQAEIDAELASVIPIAENLERVKDGDLLLSDMYLPADVISALLERAGLKSRVGLVVTATGKQSGAVWRQVRAGVPVNRHLGDNLHSDVEMPRRFGIGSEQTRLAEPTSVEQWCLENGLRALGELIRAARLRIATSGPLARRLSLVQTQYNFPMLLFASIALRRHAMAIGATRLLFASRDCHLWHALHVALFPGDPRPEYFYTSRRARVHPTAAYRAYVRARSGAGSILVDLCGTGWSSARLMETLGVADQALYFMHRLPPIQVYEQQHATPDICRVGSVIGPEREGLDHIRPEMCNYALHGSALGIREVAGAAIPVFDVDDRSVAERALVASQMECFLGMVADPCVGLAGDCAGGLGDADIVEIVARLYTLLCQDTSLHTAFGASHHREDMRTLAALRLV
jgi:hypothetical protein